MTHRRRRNWRAAPRTARGFVLITLIALLTIGGLYFFISNLSPEILRANTQQKTDKALTLARDALLGYALQYREYQASTGTDSVYGYLPMPDLGEAQNQNSALVSSPCPGEGCAKLNPVGLATGHTYIGRFPWRTLGTEPLRDGHGECLWYIVSGSHRSLANAGTMNWDTPGQIDIVVAGGTSSDLASAIANRPHDRPVAIIFAPGPPLTGQNRSASTVPGDIVTQCGGNYNPANYLDPSIAAVQGGTSVYFAGNRNVDASVTPVAVAIQGSIEKDTANTLHGKCQRSANCTTVANDQGLALTSDDLFGALRKSASFRTDINAMLERMTTCLRDQIAAGGSITPVALTGFTPPADKTVGRIPASTCYDNTQNPRGYFSHYSDQIFVAAQTASPFSVTDTRNTPAAGDDTTASCPGVLLFAGQRGSGQLRSTAAERNTPANYLEGSNLAGFITTGALAFAGPTQFSQVSATASATQTASQDIVRCIPSGPSLTVVAPTVATAAGEIVLASYAPGAGLLTLGSAGDESSYGASASALYACAWTPETQAAGSGLRSYFRFRIRRVGEGFTFAVVDGDRNGTNACGAARQHLGYSGDNGNAATPYIQAPKLAIEFDTARQCNFTTFDSSGRPACTFTEAGDTLRNGRNDPCYTTSCWSGSPLYPGTSQGNDNSSHVAIVYWGYGAALTQPAQDDNVHDQLGLPMPTDPSPRPAPRNPAPVLPYVANPAVIPGIAPLDRMGVTDVSQREFHARVELSRTFTEPVDAKDGSTAVQVQLWIEPQTARSISAIAYNPGPAPTLTVTTTSSHGLETGSAANPTYVVIRDAVPTGYNGEFVITKISDTSFTARLPSGTPNPGPYISAITWLNVSGTADQATVYSANHGLADGATVVISGAVPTEFNGTHAITRIDDNTYRFDLELSAQPGSLEPAVAAPKALTPRQIALANTTRPMSTLDPAFKPLVANTATIYDEQMAACAASAPACPNGQRCGSDNMCYRPSFRNLRLGFTTSERPTTSTTTARGQLIEITNRATTWLQ